MRVITFVVRVVLSGLGALSSLVSDLAFLTLSSLLRACDGIKMKGRTEGTENRKALLGLGLLNLKGSVGVMGAKSQALSCWRQRTDCIAAVSAAWAAGHAGAHPVLG